MPFSAFESLAQRAEGFGLQWLVEFASLLFGTWAAAMIAVLLVVAISRIPNPAVMGSIAALLQLGFVYLCLDAVSWRGEVPPGVGYPVLATVTYFALVLATWWNWRRCH